MTIDILPTLCQLANVPLPKNEIDGANVWDLIEGKKEAQNPHEYYAFSNNNNFEAVLSGDGKWKLHLPHDYRTLTDTIGKDGMPGKYKQDHIDLSLFDMVNDPYETSNVIDKYPDEARKLLGFANEHRERFFPETLKE